VGKELASGGKICLAAEVADSGVAIRVSDSGHGIAPNLLPHVFDPFRRAEQAGNRARCGLGVGLALARSLVELHGGTIVALSNGPGTGSEFVVGLPDCDPKLESDDIAGSFAAWYSVAVL
jgi:signal transduction histidine kinase